MANDPCRRLDFGGYDAPEGMANYLYAQLQVCKSGADVYMIIRMLSDMTRTAANASKQTHAMLLVWKSMANRQAHFDQNSQS